MKYINHNLRMLRKTAQRVERGESHNFSEEIWVNMILIRFDGIKFEIKLIMQYTIVLTPP